MATYYCDFSAGSDANAGTEAAPWKNASKINSGHAIGDTVLLKGGVTLTVDATIAMKSSSTLGAYGGGGYPIINGNINDTDAGAINCITLTATTGVTLNDLKLLGLLAVPAVTPTTAGGVMIVTSVNTLTMNNVWTLGGFAGFNCTATPSGSGNVFNGCMFERPWSDGVDVRGTMSVTLNHCSFRNCGNDAAALGSEDSISAHNTATFTCNYCNFYSGRRGPGLSIHTAGTCTFNQCFVFVDDNTDGNGRYVFGIDPSAGGAGVMVVKNCVIIVTGTKQLFVFRSRNQGLMTVTNNTIIVTNTHAGTITLLGTGGTSSVMTAKNNIVFYGGGDAGYRHASSVELGSLVSDYNCYYPTDTTRFIIEVTGKSWAEWQTALRDSNGIAADPLVQNSTTPTTVTDARLKLTSPCRNAGLPMADSGVLVDIRNRTRVTPDIGAWSKEFP